MIRYYNVVVYCNLESTHGQDDGPQGTIKIDNSSLFVCNWIALVVVYNLSVIFLVGKLKYEPVAESESKYFAGLWSLLGCNACSCMDLGPDLQKRTAGQSLLNCKKIRRNEINAPYVRKLNEEL